MERSASFSTRRSPSFRDDLHRLQKSPNGNSHHERSRRVPLRSQGPEEQSGRSEPGFRSIHFKCDLRHNYVCPLLAQRRTIPKIHVPY